MSLREGGLALAALGSLALLFPARAAAQQPAPTVVDLHGDDPAVALYRHVGMSDFVGVGLVGAQVGVVAGVANHVEFVCGVPCGLTVPSQFLYSVRGGGITPSPEFTLPAGQRVRVDVRTGSPGALIGGVTLTVLGVPTLIGGGALLAWSFRQRQYPSDEPADGRMAAAGVAVVGAAVLSLGLWLWGHGHTHVHVASAGGAP